MSLFLEWDAQKATANESKHGVSFDEAATDFGDSLSATIPNPYHSKDEGRFILPGVDVQRQDGGCRSRRSRRQYPHCQRPPGDQNGTAAV